MNRAGAPLYGIFGPRSALSDAQPFDRPIRPSGQSRGPFRAILFFDESAAANWSLAWHHDRTIAVRARLDVRGYGNWNTKDSM